jgi:nucleotidyltransferase-like protein
MATVERTLPDLATLEQARVPLPEKPLCVYLSGSFASGMAHASSDFDIFVVTEQPFIPEDQTGVGHVSTEPHAYPIVIRDLPEGRCDIEYWLTVQVAGLLDMFVSGNSTLGFSIEDVDFLYRLSIAQPLSGADWLAHQQEALARSEFASMVAQRSFGTADSLFEDALGMLQVGDTHSAVLAAHEGFGRAIDGLLANHHQFSPRRKWRAQKLIRARPELISLEEFWTIEAMRDFDPSQPEVWVRSVIERTRELMMEVEL